MQKLVFINGNGTQIDLTAGNFGVVNWAGLSNTSLNIQTQQVPFEDGGVFLDALMEQREIELTVAIYDGNNLSLRYQKKRELISALNPKLGEGVLIYTNDYISKQIKAVPQIPLFENKNSNDVGTLKATIVFSCPNPYWEDVNETEVTFKITEQPIINNEGDVPCQLKINFQTMGASNPEIVNETTGSMIKYNGEINLPLNISTELGKKEVYTNGFNFKSLYPKNNIKVIYISELNLFVIYGSENYIGFSSDGYHWQNTYYLGKSNFVIYEITKIIYVESKKSFYAVINGEKICKSSDLLKWEYISSITNNMNDIIYADILNMFIVVGNNGKIYTSEDCINWTSRTSGTSESLYSIAINKEDETIYVVGTNGILLYSENCSDWNSDTLGIYNFKEIIYIDSLNAMVVVGAHGTIYININYEWQDVSINDNVYFHSVCYSEIQRKFIVCGQVQTGYNFYQSFNGTDWELVEEVEDISNSINSVVYSAQINKYLAVGSNYTMFLSPDGEDWERQVFLKSDFRGMAFNKENNMYICVGNNQLILSSNDGINWVERHKDNTKSRFQDVVYIDYINLFIAVGNDGYIFISSDGLQWGSINNVTNKIIYSIAFSDEIIIAVGADGIVLKSTNGSDWEIVNTGINKTLYDLIYVEDLQLFFAVGDDEVLYKSSDGENWTQIVLNAGSDKKPLYSIAYSKDYKTLIIVGYQRAYESIDGINWVSPNWHTTSNFCSISYSEFWKAFFITDDSILYYTVDGITRNEIGQIVTMYDSLSIGDKIFLVGNDLLYSEITQKENQIQNITPDSDMNLNLTVGENKFRINFNSGDMVAVLKYRQKYIGV